MISDMQEDAAAEHYDAFLAVSFSKKSVDVTDCRPLHP
jgi:hypothetical protein